MTPSGADIARTTGPRLGGGLLLLGGVTMLAGAIVHFSNDLGIDGVIERDTIAAYLDSITTKKSAAYANLGLWMLGAGFLGLGGAALNADAEERGSAGRAIARAAYTAGVAVAWVAFFVWIALVRAAPNLDPSLAGVLAFLASRLDWLATILLVGLGPALTCSVAANRWLPRWLRAWGIAAGASSALTCVAMIAGGLESYGFIVVPVGVLWSLTAGGIGFTRSRSCDASSSDEFLADPA